MGEIKLNIIDGQRTLSGTVHDHLGDPLVAALTAEPETFHELENALRRFVIWETDSPLAGLREGEDLTPADAGLLAIDMTSRTFCAYQPESEVDDDEPDHGPHVWIETPFGDEEGFNLPFFPSNDWLILTSIEEFAATIPARRAERKAHPPIDYRAVMYGPPLFEFLAQECATIPTPAERPQSMEEDPVVSVHQKWYMTPREDLGGKTPREVLFYKRDFVERDLQWRETQWSFAKLCPPHLPTDTDAYRYSGFGTHEWVIYYYMMRELLERAVYDADRSTDRATEAARLATLKETWINAPDPEYYGRTPAGIIESERRRIGITMSAKEMIIDEDCPCCQMMAEDFDTPMFWHLDGCNMDECFEFSYHESREEYEKEQREWAQRDAEIKAEIERKDRELGPGWFQREQEENLREILGADYRGRESKDDDFDDIPF